MIHSHFIIMQAIQARPFAHPPLFPGLHPMPGRAIVPLTRLDNHLTDWSLTSVWRRMVLISVITTKWKVVMLANISFPIHQLCPHFLLGMFGSKHRWAKGYDGPATSMVVQITTSTEWWWFYSDLSSVWAKWLLVVPKQEVFITNALLSPSL